MFNLLCSSSNHNCLKEYTIQVATMKIQMIFITEAITWRWMEHKEGSMKNVSCTAVYGKRYLSGWRDVQKRKSQAHTLAIVELCKSEGISQSGRQLVSQSVENSVKLFFKKFRSNFL